MYECTFRVVFFSPSDINSVVVWNTVLLSRARVQHLLLMGSHRWRQGLVGNMYLGKCTDNSLIKTFIFQSRTWSRIIKLDSDHLMSVSVRGWLIFSGLDSVCHLCEIHLVFPSPWYSERSYDQLKLKTSQKCECLQSPGGIVLMFCSYFQHDEIF